MTEVYLYKLPDITDCEISRLMEFVSSDRKAKIQRLKHKENKCQSLFAALLLRAVLCLKLNVKNQELEFEVAEKGKPYLVGRQDVHFSVSHTQGLVAVAVSEFEIGIDVEVIKSADLKLVKRFFTADEQAFIVPETDGWLERFYLVWTRKEAYVKRSGQGLSTPLTSFSVIGESDDFTTFTTNGYVVSVCGGKEALTVPLEKVEQLLSNFLKL